MTATIRQQNRVIGRNVPLFFEVKKGGIGSAFYFAFWAILLYAKALNLTSSDRLLQLCMLAALGCLAIKYLLTDWDLHSACFGCLLCGVGLMSFLNSGNTELLITLAAIVGAKDVKLSSLIKFIFYVKLIIFVATILMAVTGIVENKWEFSEDFDGALLKSKRYYLGFIHPNYAHATLFTLIGLCSWAYYKKLNFLHYALFIIANFALYHYTQSRTGMIIVCIFCLVLAIMRMESLFKGSVVCIAIPIVMAILIYFVYAGYDHPLLHDKFVKIDNMLTGRVYYIYRIMTLPMTPWGSAQVLYEAGAGKFLLDCAFVMLLREYGFVAFYLFIFGSTLLLHRLFRQKNVAPLAFASVYLVFGFLEHFTIDVFLNPTLLLFAPFLFGNRVEREYVPSFAKPPVKTDNLVKNFGYYLTYTVLQVVIPLVTVVYVSKILGASGIGKVSFAQTVVSYFTIIASLGIPNYGTKVLSKCKTRGERDLAFSELFLINAVSTTVCLGAYLVMIFTVGYFAPLRPLYIVTGLSIALNYASVDWLYRGTEEYPALMQSSLLVKASCLVGLLIFVTDAGDVVPYALLATLALTGANILNLLHARSFVSFRAKGLNVKRHLKPVFLLLAASIAIELYTLLDTTMLGILKTDAEVGYYTTAIRLVKTAVTVITVIGGILLPRLSSVIDEDGENVGKMVKKALSVLLLICLPSTFGLFFLGDTVVLSLFGTEYFPSVPILLILSPMLLIMSVGNLFGTQVLLSAGQEKKLLWSVLCGAVVNFTMNLFLIPSFGARGAAIASVVSELVVMIVQVVCAMKYCAFELSPSECFKPLAATAIMCIALVLLRLVITIPVVELVVCLIVAVLVYFAACLALRQQEVYEVYLTVKARSRAKK